MKYLLLTLLMMTSANTAIIFDFNNQADLRAWRIVNDTVMGGRSSCSFQLNEEGQGVFEGRVSLENNGGFSSVRHRFTQRKLGSYTHLVLKVKGDGKAYQLRVKDDSRRYYAYIQYIETSGDWQEIEVPLAEMYPYFRGYRLNRPNFNHNNIEEVSLLIGNKKAEDFKLIIDQISLR